MSNIAKLDPNLAVGKTIEKEGLVFYNALSAPFEIYGVSLMDGRFRRFPEAVAKQVNKNVAVLHYHTAGGRLRFKTNSSSIAISVKMPAMEKASHFALSGSIGLDLYVKDDQPLRYVRTFMPPFDITDGYESLVELEERKEREILIHFPIYSAVSELYIGLEADATISKAPDYTYQKPFVTYGSSITQGGCASRPGNTYQAHLSRRFDIDHINLGFSGGARAEDAIVDYVAGLDMSFFIYDYDHNAPTNEHYEKTHENMFRAVRKAHPDIPILILTRPKYYLTPLEVARRAIAYRTYQNALDAGDQRVWFMDGKQLMALCKSEGTVDNCHPTDLGFYAMAQAIGDWMEENHILDLIEKA